MVFWNRKILHIFTNPFCKFSILWDLRFVENPFSLKTRGERGDEEEFWREVTWDNGEVRMERGYRSTLGEDARWALTCCLSDFETFSVRAGIVNNSAQIGADKNLYFSFGAFAKLGFWSWFFSHPNALSGCLHYSWFRPTWDVHKQVFAFLSSINNPPHFQKSQRIANFFPLHPPLKTHNMYIKNEKGPWFHEYQTFLLRICVQSK